MGKIGKIKPIQREYTPEYKNTSITGSLANHGLTRLPGTFHELMPDKMPNGGFRTGLDVNADYIKRMSAEEAEQERTRIKEWLAFLNERLPHLEFDPHSEYYRNLMKYYGKSGGEDKGVQPYKMKDGLNAFDLTNPYELITFAWLRVHHSVAPSFMAWKTGKCSPSCKYFVEDEEFQAEIEFKENQKINQAILLKESLNPSDQRKVARLLGLPVTINTSDYQVSNLLDNYIKDKNTRMRSGNSNINLFTKIANYNPENRNIRYYIKEALDFNIYRQKGNRIYDGEIELAATEEDLVLYLTDPKNIDELNSLQDRLLQAKSKELI